MIDRNERELNAYEDNQVKLDKKREELKRLINDTIDNYDIDELKKLVQHMGFNFYE